MEIDGQFYKCYGCHEWQPFMGRDVVCDCGYDNELTTEECDELEAASED